MLKERRSLQFEYVLSGDCWRMVGSEIDWEVAKLLGSILLACPHVIKSPSSPQQVMGQLVSALARHRLDGGFIHEELTEDRYRITIVVDARRDKPKQ
jgi:hypothetical protein